MGISFGKGVEAIPAGRGRRGGTGRGFVPPARARTLGDILQGHLGQAEGAGNGRPGEGNVVWGQRDLGFAETLGCVEILGFGFCGSIGI